MFNIVREDQILRYWDGNLWKFKKSVAKSFPDIEAAKTEMESFHISDFEVLPIDES